MHKPAGVRQGSVAGSLTLDARAVEARLAQLPGVQVARVVMGDQSVIQRINLTVDPEISGAQDSKRLVRNVETIVHAEFGITVNYQTISIAPGTRATPLSVPAVGGASHAASAPASTLASTLASTPASTHASTPANDQPLPMSPSRAYTLETVKLEQGRAHPTGCTVALRRGTELFTGTASVMLPREAVESLAARATLQALQKIDPRVTEVVLVGVRESVEFGDACVIAKLLVPHGQHETALYGIVPVANRAEIAAALAVLDATNRWLAVKDR
jgi:hypothetical protein